MSLIGLMHCTESSIKLVIWDHFHFCK